MDGIFRMTRKSERDRAVGKRRFFFLENMKCVGKNLYEFFYLKQIKIEQNKTTA